MVIVGILEWWYTRGFLTELARIKNSIASLYDYFSIDLLLKTLFSPFRQISAGRVRGSLAIQFRAFTDRLFSRLIGAFVRIFMIIIGSVSLLVVVIISVVRVIGWLILPLAPLVGIVLMGTGWVPWKL